MADKRELKRRLYRINKRLANAVLANKPTNFQILLILDIISMLADVVWGMVEAMTEEKETRE